MKRLYALDTLRGFAALSVVLWHWQHFFAISGTFEDGWQKSSEPFYVFLKPFYEEGWAAVDLFFALSGFIFFWLYGEAIREGRIGAWRFGWLLLAGRGSSFDRPDGQPSATTAQERSAQRVPASRALLRLFHSQNDSALGAGQRDFARRDGHDPITGPFVANAV